MENEDSLVFRRLNSYHGALLCVSKGKLSATDDNTLCGYDRFRRREEMKEEVKEEIVYMLNSYVKDGEDFLFSDNHGSVTLCKTCEYYNNRMRECSINPGQWQPFGYCSKGKKK